MIEYNNDQSEMINLFKKRGKLISALQDEAEIEKIEKKIKELKGEFKRPKSAFITFNDTKILNLINSLNKKQRKNDFCCCKNKQKIMKLEEADIVNNIKWEMRH